MVLRPLEEELVLAAGRGRGCGCSSMEACDMVRFIFDLVLVLMGPSSAVLL